jgi:GT2 family glycosyltransferase
VPSPDATVVIPTRDRSASLERCLAALRSQSTSRPWELIVVDDGSSPPLADTAVAGVTDARIIRAAGNGPARARNTGWREARASVVLFTDDDTEPAADWVESALDWLDANPSAVGVEGPVVSPPWDPLAAMSVTSDAPGGFLTANIGFRRDALVRLDGFDERFPFPHCEDYDLAFRAQELGVIGWADGMRVLHHPRPMTVRQLASRGRYGASEMVLFARHRARYGKASRLPVHLFPLVSVAHGWAKIARRESVLRSPTRAVRFLLVAGGQLAALAASIARTSLSK